MIRELNILAALTILTLLFFAAWQILESSSVLKLENFQEKQVERVSPTFPGELLPEI